MNRPTTAHLAGAGVCFLLLLFSLREQAISTAFTRLDADTQDLSPVPTAAASPLQASLPAGEPQTERQGFSQSSSWYVVQQYYDTTNRLMQEIMAREQGNLDRATDLMAASIREGRLIHVFGTGGHNVMAAMEIFKRAGSLVPLNALFPPGLSVADAHPLTERLVGYAKPILSHYGVQRAGDVLIIINVNGINAVTIDAAMEAKKMGLTVIAVTSRNFSSGVPKGIPARHPSNQNLADLGDIVIDTYVPPGDAVIDVANFEHKVSSISTMTNTFVVQALVAMTVDKLVKMGLEPEVWASANVRGGAESNLKYKEKYGGKIYHLSFY
jgi:uncharacterized phosphosugar-binding protein